MTKILINLVTLSDRGPFVPWLSKFKYFQDRNINLFLNDGLSLTQLPKITNIYNFHHKIPKHEDAPNSQSRFVWIIYCLRRNLLSLKFLFKISKDFDTIYSPSSVLDLILIPYLAKIINPSIKWFTVLDNTVPFQRPGNIFVRILAKVFFILSVFMLHRADHIFVVNPLLKQYLIDHSFNPKKITVTGNAIETDLIQKVKAPSKSIDALYVGRLNEAKGIFDLIKVLKILTNKLPDFKLHLMGEGDKPTLQKLSLLIQKYGLSSNIIFLGYRSGLEKYKIIKSARTFWFLSYDESFGVALLEAVACGIPCFAYSLPPFKYIYKNHEVFQAPLGNYKKIAKLILKTFKTKQFINYNGKALLHKYTWENIAAEELKEILCTTK